MFCKSLILTYKMRRLKDLEKKSLNDIPKELHFILVIVLSIGNT